MMPSIAVSPEPSRFVASSCQILSIAIVTASPSGSVTPLTEIVENLWFGGQSIASLGAAAVQLGSAFAARIVIVTFATFESITWSLTLKKIVSVPVAVGFGV